ncbi:MAG: biopolymer transporter ExbD [Planctomycetota bacterium]
MRIPHSSSSQRDFDVSMTPMIDVVFLLLIFFVCTASFELVESVLPSHLAPQEKNEATLPRERAGADLERILISVGEVGNQLQLSVNGQACASLTRLSTLLQALASVDISLPVVLDVDGTTRLGTAIDVYDRCRLANFARIQFVAEAPE